MNTILIDSMKSINISMLAYEDIVCSFGTGRSIYDGSKAKRYESNKGGLVMKKLVFVIDGGMFNAAYTDDPDYFTDAEILALDQDVPDDELYSDENEQLRQMIDAGQLKALQEVF